MKNFLLKRSSRNMLIAIAVALTIALTLGGTFALRDFNQHKTNVLGNTNKNIDVTLNEDFKPNDKWAEGEIIDKTANVTNVAEPDGELVYVRLILKEYMDIIEFAYAYYMDPDSGYIFPYRMLCFNATAHPSLIGRYITHDNYPDAADYAAAIGYPASRVVGPFTNALAADPAEALYYIKTDFEDDDGQYGKYLVENISDLGVTVVAGRQYANPNGSATLLPDPWPWDKVPTEHGAPLGDSFEYNGFIPYIWGSSDPVRDYVGIIFGDDVISVAGWDGLPFDGWIYDNAEPVPYAYYGRALKPGETTANFLKAVELLVRPEGQFYYSIRIDMEAAIKDQLDDLTGAPQSILDAWEASRS